MMRFRNIYLILGSLAVVGALIWTDPDGGISTGLFLLGLFVCLLAVVFAHVSRKALTDYPEADMQRLFKRAAESPTGSGLALIALAIIFASLLLLFGSKVNAQTVPAQDIIPVNAHKYIQQLKVAQRNFWPDHPEPHFLAGLIEQETCYSLVSPSCWSPKVRALNSREEGAGLGQITRAFAQNGTLRFDMVQHLQSNFPQLAELTWNNIYERPDLQIAALVLLNRQNYLLTKKFADNHLEALAFADAAYNGGIGGLQRDRRACFLTDGCNPGRWFNNVEMTCTKGIKPVYGSQSFCDINRTHVKNVILVRSDKYKPLMF
jgi:hypothetical protein